MRPVSFALVSLLLVAGCGDCGTPMDDAGPDPIEDGGPPPPPEDAGNDAGPPPPPPDAGSDAGVIPQDDAGPLDPDAGEAPLNAAPTVSIAAVADVLFPTVTAVLDGSASDDGLPAGSTLETTWSLVDGPGAVAFTDETAPGTQVTFTAPGGYTLRLTATDGELSGSAEVTVHVRASPADVGERVVGQIGPLTVNLGQTLHLTLVKPQADDGLQFCAFPIPLPAGMNLDKYSGAFSFKPQFPQVGTHEVRFTAMDNFGAVEETVTITVVDPAPAEVTLHGRIVDANNANLGDTIPLGNVLIRHIETQTETFSDANGFFALTFPNPEGDAHIEYDGALANEGRFAGYRERREYFHPVDDYIERPVYLMVIDIQGESTIESGLPTTVNNPNLGSILEVPADGVVGDDGALYTGPISLSEVPAGFTPGAMPPEMSASRVVTLQPMGITFIEPAPLTMPNLDGLEPFSEVNLWSLNHSTGRFFVAGKGEVTADGSQIVTVSGGLREASWHYVMPPALDPSSTRASRPKRSSGRPCPKGSGASTCPTQGDVSASADPPKFLDSSISRGSNPTYSSQAADPTPVVSTDLSTSVRSAVPPTSSMGLNVGGVDQGAGVTDTSGLNENDDDIFRLKAGFSARDLGTGVYPFVASVRQQFGASQVGVRTSGLVAVRNERQNPVGVGWRISDVACLYPGLGDDVVIAAADGTVNEYRQAYALTPHVVSTNYNDYNNEVVPGDFNGDGRIDLATAGYHDVSILWGDGRGGFEQGPITEVDSYAGSAMISELHPLDFNDDGVLDLGMIRTAQPNGFSGNHGIYVLTGNGDGTFTIGPRHAPASFMRKVRFANLDGDDDLDAVAYRTDLGRWAVFLGNGDDTFGAALPYDDNVDQGNTAEEMGLADFDGDGILDVLRARTSGLRWAKGAGDGTFAPFVSPFASWPSSFISAAAFGDVDADGDVDIVAAAYYDDLIYVVQTDGSGGLQRISDFDSLPAPLFLTSLALADMGGDGIVDLVVGKAGSLSEPGQIQYLRGLGNGDFQAPQMAVLPSDLLSSDPHAEPTRVSVTDFNSDGFPDLALRNYWNSTLQVVLGGETGDALVSQPGDLSVVVYNGDGTYTQTLPGGTVLEFESEGCQLSSTDNDGNVVSYSYDAEDRLSSITYPGGSVETFSYDTSGWLESITSPAGSTTFTHDPLGHLSSVTYPDGASRLYAYDARGRLILLTNEAGEVSAFSYDALGRLSQTVLPDGSSVGLQAAASKGAPLTGTQAPAELVRPDDDASVLTDAAGNETRVFADSFGEPVRTEDALGNVTVMERDQNGNIVRMVDALGVEVLIERDEAARVVSLTAAVGTALERTNTLTYEPAADSATALREPLTTTDPLGNVVTYTYDAAGHITSVTDPLGNVVTYTYDSRGNVLTFTDAIGGVTNYGYDALGNLGSVTDPEGQVTLFLRDAAGRLTQLGTQAGSSTFVYDAVGRLTSTTDPTGAVTTLARDEAGNVISLTNGTGETTSYSYDSLGRVTSVQDPHNGQTAIVYDAAGNVRTVTDELGNVTTFTYDAIRRLLSSTDALGNVQSVSYDAIGRPVSRTDGMGRQTSNTFDVLGRLTRRTGPLGEITDYVWDLGNHVVSVTDPNGQTLTHSYDDAGRRTQTTTADDALSYVYDDASNLLEVSDSDTSVVLTRNANFQPLTATSIIDDGVTPLSVTLSYGYDEVGNRTSLTDSFAAVTGYGFDAAGRLTALTPPAGSALALSFDAASRPIGISYPNGVEATYAYSSNGLLSSIHEVDAGSTDIQNQSYSYDALGRIASVVGSDTVQYAYDALSRLTSAGTASAPETYAYDASGNRTSSHISGSYTHDDSDRLIEEGGYTYTYDNNGNVLSKTDDATSDVTTYTWDALNRLTQVDMPNGDVVTFRYDGLGRRVEKAVNGTITRYVHDGANVYLELDDAGAVTARYLHSGSLDRPLVMQRGGANFYYHLDHQGSVKAVTDSSGAVVNQYAYDAYGFAAVAVEGVTNPLRFTGRPYDAETGLQQTRARYYDPSTGRFLARDPLASSNPGESAFAYAGNDPVNYADPTGLEAEEGTIAGLKMDIIGNSLGALGDRLNANALRLSDQLVNMDPKSASFKAGLNKLLGSLDDANKVAGVGKALGLLGTFMGALNEYNSIDECDPSRAAQAAAVTALGVAIGWIPVTGALQFGSNILDTVLETAGFSKLGAFETINNVARISTILATGDVRSGEAFLDRARKGDYGSIVENVTSWGDAIATPALVDHLSQLFE